MTEEHMPRRSMAHSSVYTNHPQVAQGRQGLRAPRASGPLLQTLCGSSTRRHRSWGETDKI